VKKKKKTARRSPKRQSAPKKPTYQTRNSREYNQALVNRGSLTIWFEEGVLENWRLEHSGQRGASRLYSDLAILTALTLKVVFHQPLRATQGMLASLLKLMGAAHLPTPHYSTICRRQKTLTVPIARKCKQSADNDSPQLHLVVDSTGCKIFGEGEWKVRQHGYTARRTWRKVHIGLDEATQEILAVELTKNDVDDAEILPTLLEQVTEPIAQVSADGGYDKRKCYEALRKRGEEQGSPIKVTIPPRHDAVIWQHGNCKGERLARDENLRTIRKIGRKRWKAQSGYHRRSLVETGFYRLKTIFGDKLKARTIERQRTEALVRCAALNTMTALGMPDSYPV
jgi:IS5 family transposase